MRDHGYKVSPEQDAIEFDWLLDRVEKLAPKRILEIGCRLGAALVSFVRVSVNCELAVGVDNPAPGWDCSRAWEAFVPRGRVIPFTGISQDVSIIADVAKLAPFDFVHIDGDHRYEAVKADYNVYSELVAPGGLIALHDITPTPKNGIAVHRLWAEIKASGAKTEEFINMPEFGAFGIGCVWF